MIRNKWYQEELKSVHRKTIGKLELLLSDSSIPCSIANESYVIVNANPKEKLENFIDDTFFIGIYEKENSSNLNHAYI